MKQVILAATAVLALGTSAAVAQSSGSGVRIKPGQVCADNKCVRFAPDLKSAYVSGRRAISVERYSLRRNPVISVAAFREIFALGLRQSGRGVDR